MSKYRRMILDEKLRKLDKSNVKQLVIKALILLKWLYERSKEIGRTALTLFAPFKVMVERWLNKVKGMRTDEEGKDGVFVSKIKTLGKKIASKFHDVEFLKKLRKLFMVLTAIFSAIATYNYLSAKKKVPIEEKMNELRNLSGAVVKKIVSLQKGRQPGWDGVNLTRFVEEKNKMRKKFIEETGMSPEITGKGWFEKAINFPEIARDLNEYYGTNIDPDMIL